MSNFDKGGVTENQKKERIIEALDNLTPDVLDLLYRIIFCVESGME